jgi:tRNA threonylcarbamoyladenosine biosynthesis protein TsaB
MASRMLAFDTSADVTAVAVLDGDAVIIEDCEPTAERHAETLLPRIEQCLARAGVALAEIDVFAVGIGPGSFTGVRVGVATAKGLALATGKPLRGVVSLAALAGSVLERESEAELLVAPILDAFKGEVFAALYSVSAAHTALIAEPFHAQPEVAAELLARAAAGRTLRVLGSGYRRYADRIAPAWDAAKVVVLDAEVDTPRARHVAREARRLLAVEGPSDTARLAPLYVRDSDAQLPKSPLRM